MGIFKQFTWITLFLRDTKENLSALVSVKEIVDILVDNCILTQRRKSPLKMIVPHGLIAP